jgi:hypothetical protein
VYSNQKSVISVMTGLVALAVPDNKNKEQKKAITKYLPILAIYYISINVKVEIPELINLMTIPEPFQG